MGLPVSELTTVLFLDPLSKSLFRPSGKMRLQGKDEYCLNRPSIVGTPESPCHTRLHACLGDTADTSACYPYSGSLRV